MADLERLQTTLDEIAEMVEWAAEWLETLEDEVSFAQNTDRPILEAEAARLRLVADALVPGRVRDDTSGQRWYLAPDEASQRAARLEGALDRADREVERIGRETEERRAAAEHRDRRHQEDNRRREADRRRESEKVASFLRDHGAATAKEIAQATGLSTMLAEIAAGAVAKRGRDRRFRLTEEPPPK